ncbi:iron ABC transporter permease (plasmid) [Rhizobium sp. NIBRBAC000502774]|nr:iron ABC transporter permease [Rhizobium sp. NIBRBAC000502774]
MAALSIGGGTTRLSLPTVFEAIFAFDGSRDHLVITMLRLPRVLAGLLAGAALGVAGSVMQAATGNPLASPGLLGINAGAAFAVVGAMALQLTGSMSDGNSLIWYAFGGAAIAGFSVHMLGSLGSRGSTSLKLVLAGAVIGTFLTSLTSAILIFDQATLDAIRLWTVGSLSGRNMGQIIGVAPYIATGLAAALLLRGQFTTLSLGSDISGALGQNPLLWRTICVIIVVMLAGGAVALAGPVGFVGLVMPHAARLTVGADYRWIVPYSAIGGALLLVTADTVGRSLFAAQDFPVGVTMALIGAPFFLWLARYRLRSA